MAFIKLDVAADRLGISLAYFRNLIDRADRKETVLDPDPTADFWTSTTAVIPERDLRTYENMLARRRFMRFREKFADVLIDHVELSCRPGWKSLLERVAERVRWMPSEWNVRLRKAREKSGYLVLGFEYDRDQQAACNEIERFREEIRLSSLSMCEECGRQARFRYSPSRSLTLCDRHARLAEPTLPGDGVMADPAFDEGLLSELPSD
ncbi:hypothetical protein [Rhizobium leguminosarum]|uniref:hypothetical protein n=1 Tax=Rhizobium leguminosarum TaxID=384 RepID=UPI001C95BA51|nr:hypothetical protein [Rhizobium leguminosarum]MBY5318227.1 hypothetical protein [Rhizobium leguminosarum]